LQVLFSPGRAKKEPAKEETSHAAAGYRRFCVRPNIYKMIWQAGQESNLQPAVLETAALPN
jgi:hypothetical protein